MYEVQLTDSLFNAGFVFVYAIQSAKMKAQ